MPFPVPPPAPPVSYSRHVAPIFALHCNGCHGDAGGLDLRAYADLMKGGNLGRVVTPGDPERSVLVHFLDGRRGEAQTMPQGGEPLTSDQLETIRRWIAEGARDDATPTRKYTFTVPKVHLARGKALRVYCRVNTESYLILTVHDSRNRLLLTETASIKSPKEQVDAGQPGDLIWWDVRSGTGWPKWINLELTIEYAAAEPQHTEFFAR